MDSEMSENMAAKNMDAYARLEGTCYLSEMRSAQVVVAGGGGASG